MEREDNVCLFCNSQVHGTKEFPDYNYFKNDPSYMGDLIKKSIAEISGWWLSKLCKPCYDQVKANCKDVISNVVKECFNGKSEKGTDEGTIAKG